MTSSCRVTSYVMTCCRIAFYARTYCEIASAGEAPISYNTLLNGIPSCGTLAKRKAG